MILVEAIVGYPGLSPTAGLPLVASVVGSDISDGVMFHGGPTTLLQSERSSAADLHSVTKNPQVSSHIFQPGSLLLLTSQRQSITFLGSLSWSMRCTSTYPNRTSFVNPGSDIMVLKGSILFLKPISYTNKKSAGVFRQNKMSYDKFRIFGILLE